MSTNSVEIAGRVDLEIACTGDYEGRVVEGEDAVVVCCVGGVEEKSLSTNRSVEMVNGEEALAAISAVLQTP